MLTPFSVTSTIKADTFKVGRPIRFEAWFLIGSKGSGPGTLTLGVKLNASVVSALPATTLATGLNNEAILVRGRIIPRTLGTGGTVFVHLAAEGLAADPLLVAAVTPDTINTTIDQVLSFTAQFSLADSNNIIALESLIVD